MRFQLLAVSYIEIFHVLETLFNFHIVLFHDKTPYMYFICANTAPVFSGQLSPINDCR